MLIAINGFFVAGEFALVAVNRPKVEAAAAEGDRRAKRLAARLKDLSFELSGAQLGITLTSLILGAVAEPTVARLIEPLLSRVGLESVSIVIALILATVFQMILGELFPKNVAIARSYKASFVVGLPMATVNQLLRPLIMFFNRSANWTVRKLGIEPRDDLAGLRSMRELEMIVRASTADGDLDEGEASLLTRAIAFVGKDAADAMVPRVSVVGLSTEASVDEVRATSVETGHSRFPVFDGDLDSIVGVVHVKDTLRVAPGQRATTSAGAVAIDAPRVPESIRLDTLLVELQSNRKSMAIVVDEYGGTAGIVTIEDIVEEILGEIEDEYDPTPESESVGPTGLSGGLHRGEVEELTGLLWPEGSYETLNGFVTDALDRFPQPGDVVEVDGFRIEVITVDGEVADSLVVRPPSDIEREERES